LSYKISLESFEGPFDLLLALVSEQKIDIGKISVADIADQYLAHIEGIRDFDMDVASDFLVVAATLLAIKTEALLPESASSFTDDIEEYSPEEARDLLVSRLLVYKQFKNAAAALSSRLESEGRMHARQVGLESEFVGLLPDYLEGVSLQSLAVICADLAARREVFLLEAEHIVAHPMEIEDVLASIVDRLKSQRTVSFSELVDDDPRPDLVVASFLSLLELYHRGMIDLSQSEAWGDIDIAFKDEADWQPAVNAAVDLEPIDVYLQQIDND